MVGEGMKPRDELGRGKEKSRRNKNRVKEIFKNVELLYIFPGALPGRQAVGDGRKGHPHDPALCHMHPGQGVSD